MCAALAGGNMMSMDLTDYLITFGLVAIVARQIRERKLDWSTLVLPAVLVFLTTSHYLKHVPTGGHDVAFDVLLGALGAAFGLLSGAFTHMRLDTDGSVLARAGVAAAGLWIAGIAIRFGIELYSNYGGTESLTHFSAAHQITSTDAWTAALVIMALAEVGSRLALMQVLRLRMERSVRGPAAVAA
jgi:hypothetical protein